MVLFFVACAGTQANTTDGTEDSSDARVEATESHAVVKRLSSTADLCAWHELVEAEAEEPAVPEGDVAGWLNESYQPCLDGMGVVSSRILEHPQGRLEESEALATFFTETKPEYQRWKAEWLDPLEGDDDCALVTVGKEGLVSESDLVWLDPGVVTLLGPSERVWLDRTEGRVVLSWTAELPAAADGGIYGLDVADSVGGLGWVRVDRSSRVGHAPRGLGAHVACRDRPRQRVSPGGHHARVDWERRGARRQLARRGLRCGSVRTSLQPGG